MTKALLLDLDGTLLDIQFDHFMRDYLTGTSSYFSDVIPPEKFQQQLLASTGAMLFNDDPKRSVEEAFFEDFGSALPLPDDATERFETFYEQDFPALSKWGKPMPGARDLIEAALAKDLPVVIATAPLFPESAIRERLRWAGVEDLPFRLLTTSDTMRRSKPHPEYYVEIAQRIGIPTDNCFMIGDETVMDGAAATAGMRVAFVGPEKPSSSRHWLDRFKDGEKIRAKAALSPRFPDLAAVHEHLRELNVL